MKKLTQCWLLSFEYFKQKSENYTFSSAQVVIKTAGFDYANVVENMSLKKAYHQLF